MGIELSMSALAGAGLISSQVLDFSTSHSEAPVELTASDHNAMGAALLHKALRSRSVERGNTFRREAYEHFRAADILENGPYQI